MAISLSAVQRAELSKDGAHWLWHVRLTDSSSSVLPQVDLISGQRSRFGYEAAVLDFSGGRQSLDLLQYKSSIDAARMKVSHQWWANFVATFRIQSYVVTVSIGTSEMAVADFVTVFVGSVKDYRTDGMVAEVQLRDPRTKLDGIRINPARYAVNKHPADVIKRIWADFLDSSEYTDPFDGGASPSDSFASTDWGHYIADGFGLPLEEDTGTGVGSALSSFAFPPTLRIEPAEEVDALEFIDALALMCECVVVGGGPLKLVPIHNQDVTSAFVRTLDERDCRFEYENALENFYNRCTVGVARRLNQRDYRIRADAVQSQGGGVFATEQDFPYASGIGRVGSYISVGSDFLQGDTTISLGDRLFGGTGWSGISNELDIDDALADTLPGADTRSYPTEYQLTATDPCYALLTYDLSADFSGLSNPESNLGLQEILNQPPEIISIDAWQPHVEFATPGAGSQGVDQSPYFVGQERRWLPSFTSPSGGGLFGRVNARGLFGTNESNWVEQIGPNTDTFLRPHAVDVTAAVRWARAQIDRYSEGAPVITAMTTGRHIDLELGDLVKVDSRRIAWYRNSSADSSTDFRWRVVAVKRDPFSGDGAVELTLMLENNFALIGTEREYTYIREGERKYIDTATNEGTNPSYALEQTANIVLTDNEDTDVQLSGVSSGTNFLFGTKLGAHCIYTVPAGGSFNVGMFANLSLLNGAVIASRDQVITVTNTGGTFGVSGGGATVTGDGANVEYTVSAIDSSTFKLAARYNAGSAGTAYLWAGLLTAPSYTPPP